MSTLTACTAPYTEAANLQSTSGGEDAIICVTIEHESARDKTCIIPAWATDYGRLAGSKFDETWPQGEASV